MTRRRDDRHDGREATDPLDRPWLGVLVVPREIARLWWGLVTDLADTVLVWIGAKYWPATGRARWVEDTPVDREAGSWQRYLRPAQACPHRDAHGAPWVVRASVRHAGTMRQASVCVQCYAYWVGPEPRGERLPDGNLGAPSPAGVS